jgi:membrane protein DedA with SNARE-associated domain
MAQWIEQFIRSGGYWALALITFIENVFPPIPSEVIIPLGGYLAVQGKLTLWGVVLAGTVGSILGAIVLYYVGKFLNQQRVEAWVERHGQWLLLNTSDVTDAFGWFDKHGSAAVFFCRMIPGLRSLISVPAGASGMHLGKFLLYSTAGTALWTLGLSLVGMWLGQQYEEASGVLQWLNYIVIGMIVISIISWYIKRRNSRGQEEQSAARSGD